MNNEETVRKQLLSFLRGGKAHMTFDLAVADFPTDLINRKTPQVSYTPWQLLEHLRMAQQDILEFIRNPNHVSPAWPDGYWPTADIQADENQWENTIKEFQSDLQTLAQLVENPDTNLYADLPHAKDYNILREILLVADHNAYHIGGFIILRRLMNNNID